MRKRAVLSVLLVLALGCIGAGQPGEAASCVRVHGEARYRTYGYDHVVVLESACTRAAQCEVSTDVNPAPQLVMVEPRTRVEVLTFRGSPARQFMARARCSLAGAHSSRPSGRHSSIDAISIERRAEEPR